MKRLRFNINCCGICADTVSDKIMIYRPCSVLTRDYTVEGLKLAGISTVEELIGHLKDSEEVREFIGSWGMEVFHYDRCYVNYKDYLLGFSENKIISEVFTYLDSEELEFSFFIVGGASIHNEMNYKFIVRSAERAHIYMPHVHVEKADIVVRYSLESLQPIDRLVNPHKRDNRKIIRPFLIKNQERLLEMWKHNMNGYYTPTITEEERQFYRES